MTTRNATGGNVRRHATRDLWEGRYTGPDGRRHSLYAPTRGEAQERLRAALSAADAGLAPVRGRETVAAYLAGWTATVGGHVRPRTAESYASTVRLYIVPHVGRVSLAKLTADDVARMVAA